jgi:hypothetical protein
MKIRLTMSTTTYRELAAAGDTSYAGPVVKVLRADLQKMTTDVAQLLAAIGNDNVEWSK